jgi:hypothetical protein
MMSWQEGSEESLPLNKLEILMITITANDSQDFFSSYSTSRATHRLSKGSFNNQKCFGFAGKKCDRQAVRGTRGATQVSITNWAKRWWGRTGVKANRISHNHIK